MGHFVVIIIKIIVGHMAEENPNRYADFDALLRRHKGLIRALCWWYASGNDEQCRDLVQEVCLALWTYRETLREGATGKQERAWVRLHCRSVFSHQRRRKRVTTVPLTEELETAAPDNELRERLEEATEGLNERERMALQMMMDGYSHADIGRLLGIKARSVGMLRHRIIEKIRKNKGI